jgi:hypothetical protein
MSIFNQKSEIIDNLFKTNQVAEKEEENLNISGSHIPQHKSIFNPDYTPPSIPRKETVAQFRNNPQVAKIAGRFLDSIGRNSENIVEFLRDSEFSPGAAMVRSFEVGDWSEQDKKDYEYLQKRFQNTEIKGFNERLALAKDFAIDTFADPLQIVTLLVGGPILSGATKAGVAANKVAGKIVADDLAKLSKSKLAGQALKAGKGTALFGAAEGAAFGGGIEYFNQRIDYGLNNENVDWGEVATTTGLGALLGGGIGGAIGAGVYFNKAYRFSNENQIIDDVSKVNRKELVDENDVDVNFPKEKDFIKDKPQADSNNIFNFLSHVFVEKPTTRFIKMAAESETLKSLLSKFRYDWDKTFTSSGEDLVKADSYGLFLGKKQGYYLTELKKAFRVLDREGWWGKISQKDQDEVIQLLVNPNLKKLKNGKAPSEYSRDAAKKIKNLFDEAFKDGVSAGLFKNFQQVKNYFPRKFNYQSILRNRAEFEELLVNSKHSKPLNEIEEVTYIDLDGNKVKGTPEDAQFEDMEVFMRDFVKDVSEGRTSVYDELTPDEQLRARQKKATAIVDGMLTHRFTPFELQGQKGQASGYAFMQHRLFTDIPDEKLLPFIEKDLQSVLEDYFVNVSQGISRSKFFGRTTTDFREKFLDKIDEELQASGYSPDEAHKITNKLGDMYKRVTGLNNDTGFFTGKRLQGHNWQNASEWGRLIQQMAHLPLATVSSLTEPFILLARVGITPDKALPAMGDIFTALGKETYKTFQKLGRATYRGVTGKKTKGFSDIDDDAWKEIYSTGLALEQAVLERLEGLSGEALNGTARTFSNGFFQLNLLSQWTAAVQLASFTTGKRLIRQNAERLYRKQQGENITLFGMNEKATEDYLTKQLGELGIEKNKAINWYKNSLNKEGKFDIKLSESGTNLDFYANEYLGGANRFTKEVILNPSAAEANRPLWFSSPAGQLLVQFAGYPTVFNNTVLKNFVNEIVTNGPNGLLISPKVLGTMLLMTAVAGVGNNIRSNGRALAEVGGVKNLTDISDEDVQKFYLDSVQRWGGLGIGDYARRFYQNHKIGGGDLGVLLKTPTGPLVQDFVDSLLYRKGIEEAVLTNLPFYSAYDFILGNEEEGESPLVEKLKDLEILDKNIELGRQPIKKFARDAKKYRVDFINKLLGLEEQKTMFNTGGVVRQRYTKGKGVMSQEGPKVPNSKEDPAEAINPRTGLTYEGKTPVEQQMDDLLEERTGFALGGGYDSKSIIDDLSKQFMNAQEQRNFEADAAESLNKLVNEQRLPEEYKLTITGDKNKVRYVEGSNDPFNELKHLNLGIRYGNSVVGTTLINARELGQMFQQGRFSDSATDIKNNLAGLNLLKKAKGNPEEAYKLAIQEIENKYKQQDREGFAVGALARNVLKLFHGSQRNFKNFDNSFSSPGEIGKGLYFSPDKKIAKKFSKSADWRKYTNLTEQQRIEKRTDPTPTIYEVEVKISPDELLDAKKSLKEQNPIVRNKILTLVSEKLKDKDILDIEFSKPKFWRQILKKLKTEADELFPSYGIKGIFREDKKGSAFSVASGNKQYSIFDTDIIKIIDKKEI